MTAQAVQNSGQTKHSLSNFSLLADAFLHLWAFVIIAVVGSESCRGSGAADSQPQGRWHAGFKAPGTRHVTRRRCVSRPRRPPPCRRLDKLSIALKLSAAAADSLAAAAAAAARG